MVNSMTGFATLEGALAPHRWRWEIRGVNGRGLDIRLRLPEGLGDIESTLRKAIAARLRRGNISVGLRLQTEGGPGEMPDPARIDRVLAALGLIEARANALGQELRPSSAAEILSSRALADGRAGEQDDEQARGALIAALASQIEPLVEAFALARADEGAALERILGAQLDQIEKLVEQARTRAAERRAQMAETLRRNLAMVLENSDGVDPDRLAQELALIAVKADVTEEIDRLSAHVAAARALLETDGPVGRKFDFLMQEFNREANTLCSKSGSTDLTRIGLDLKTVIDQMREQVQNVE